MRPLERLGVARGPITYRFRNGLQFTFKAMPVRTSLAIVEEVIYDTPYSNSALALSSGDVVVDIGANCGAFSILQNHLISGLTIHAYEPDPENYSFLIKNIQDSDTSAFTVTPPVPHPQSLVAHQCAVVGDNHTSDFVTLYQNPEQMGSHSTESHMD